MKKFFRKFLIYLLAVGMLCPAWLATGVLKATHVKAAEPEDIIITEYMVDPDLVSDNVGEWIEVYNTTSAPIDLTNWSVSDDSTAHPISTARVDATIASGGYGLICKESDVLENGGITDCDYKASIELSNTGGAITLKDNSSIPKAVFIAGYYQNDVVAGKSRYINSSSQWIDETQNTYGKGDFGTPGYSFFEVSPVAPVSGSYLKGTANFSFPIKSDNPIGTERLELDIYKAGSLSKQVDLAPNNADLNLGLTTLNTTDPQFAEPITSAGYDSLTKTWTISVDTKMQPSAGINYWSDGEYAFHLALWDVNGSKWGSNNAGASNKQVFSYTIDNTAPIITGVESGKNYDTSVTPAFNEGNGLLNGKPFTSGTLIDQKGVYILTVTDTAGNAMTVNFSVKSAVLTSPVVSATVTGKTIKLTWNSVDGAVEYHVYLKNKANGAISNADMPVANLGSTVLEYQNNVDSYGSYYVVVTAEDALGNISAIPVATDQKLINISAPAVTVAAAPARAAQETPVVTTGPTSAQVAPPADNAVQTPADDSAGQIKGDESTNNDKEKTNWTPWIVLFVLILLAGAATGGYFYWFNGEDEVKAAAPVAATKDVKKGDDAVKTTVRNKNGQGKQKRW